MKDLYLLLLSLFLAVTALLWAVTGRQLLEQADPSEYFLQVINGEFVAGCTVFPISGTNQKVCVARTRSHAGTPSRVRLFPLIIRWELMEAAAGGPRLSGSSLPPGVTGPELVTQVFDQAKAAGFNVIRAWAHGVSAEYPVLLGPGSYNEGMLKGLDFALDEARKRGLKVRFMHCAWPSETWPR